MVNKEEIINHLGANNEELTEILWQETLEDSDVKKLSEAVKDNTYCRSMTITGMKSLSIESEKLLFDIHKKLNENHRNYEIQARELKKAQEKQSKPKPVQNLGTLFSSTANELIIFNTAGLHPKMDEIGRLSINKVAIFKKYDKPDVKKIVEIIQKRATTDLKILKVGRKHKPRGYPPSSSNNHEEIFIPNKCIIKTITQVLMDPQCQIQELHLENCRIDTSALKELFKAIKYNKSLLTLNLCITERAEDAFSTVPEHAIATSIIESYLIPGLEVNTTLRQLDLTERDLNKKCVLNLLKGLTKNTNTALQVLKVDSQGKSFSYEGEHIDYSNPGIKFYNEKFFKKIAALLENNYSLCELDITKVRHVNTKHAKFYEPDALVDLAMKECQQILERNQNLAKNNTESSEEIVSAPRMFKH